MGRVRKDAESEVWITNTPFGEILSFVWELMLWSMDKIGNGCSINGKVSGNVGCRIHAVLKSLMIRTTSLGTDFLCQSDNTMNDFVRCPYTVYVFLFLLLFIEHNDCDAVSACVYSLSVDLPLLQVQRHEHTGCRIFILPYTRETMAKERIESIKADVIYLRKFLYFSDQTTALIFVSWAPRNVFSRIR